MKPLLFIAIFLLLGCDQGKSSNTKSDKKSAETDSLSAEDSLTIMVGADASLRSLKK